MLKYWLLFIISFTSLTLFSQQTIYIAISDKIKNLPGKIISQSTDSIIIQKEVKLTVDSLKDLGYLAPQVLDNYNDSTIAIVKGIQYKWAKIKVDKRDNDIIENAGFHPGNWEKRYISPSKIKNLSELVLTYLDNSGYPFANINFDSIRFIGTDSIVGKLKIEKNKKVYFDSINIISKVDISNAYLQNYLNIHKGEIFDKSKLEGIQKKINNLQFLKLNHAPFITFFGNEATLNLDLKPAKINRFDLLLGLIPDKTGVRKYKLTGEITAQMVNKLGRGESLFFIYKNLAQGKQNLNLEVNYPYLLNLPFGIDSKLGIYIYEDQYRDVNIEFGARYIFKGNNYVKSYWRNLSSRLLNIDTVSILSLGKLPDKLDVSSNSIGIQISYSNLDYRFNPRKGISLYLDANAGQRKTIKNLQIINLKNSSFDFENSYDTIQSPGYIFNISTKIAYFHPLSKNIVFKIENQSAYKITSSKLYQNELFRLGGNKILRGFDEESILADLYSILTGEIRLLIDQNSYLFAFADYAYIHDNYSPNSVVDTPLGFGAGINFDTKSGILSLTAAVGKQYDNPINFKDVKIHIGYVSIF